MKKHLILLLFTGLISLSSCSSDDDGDTADHSIVATWTLQSVNPPVLNLEECPENPTITFNADGTADWTMYDAENDCAVQTDSGQWEQNSESSYTVTIPGIGTLDGQVEFQSKDDFTFSSSYMQVPVTLTFTK